MAQVFFKEPEPPSQLRPGLSPGLDAVCARALAKKTAQRYVSMAELAAALEPHLRQDQPAATPRPPGAPVRHVSCPACGQKLRCADSGGGKNVRCPRGGAAFALPGAGRVRSRTPRPQSGRPTVRPPSRQTLPGNPPPAAAPAPVSDAPGALPIATPWPG